MSVLVMHIRHVGMHMLQRGVAMRMCMRLAGRIVRTMLVLVMGIMDVWMNMLHRLMKMFVSVMLGYVKPDTNRHQEAGTQNLN